MSFGENVSGINYKVVDERVMRGSAGVMFLLAVIAFINGFIIKNYIVLPYIAGFLVINFFIGIFINPRFSPTVLISKLFVRKQNPIFIGAVQKQFAWSLGLVLSISILILSLFLLQDESYFDRVCELCLICLALLYLETAFGICVGCKLYDLAIKTKLLKTPEVKPNCSGDSCATAVEN